VVRVWEGDEIRLIHTAALAFRNQPKGVFKKTETFHYAMRIGLSIIRI
jgi:hypothetical protein